MMDPKFIVDGMLGSLARKLRIYGFNVFYRSEAEDDEIIRISKDEGRVIVSRDKELCRRALARGLEAVYVKGGDDAERLAYIFKELNLNRELNLIETRCPLCNGRLVKISKEEVKSLPKKVLERYDDFYRCRDCGQIYWEGSHWERLINMDRRVKSLISKGNI